MSKLIKEGREEIKRALLLMKYDTKKTLTENKKTSKYSILEDKEEQNKNPNLVTYEDLMGDTGKLFLKENYDPNKEFLEGRETRVIVSIPNKNNPKDPNSCKVLRYATPQDQKLRLDPKNSSNYEKSQKYTTICYMEGDLARKMKIFDQSDGKQQISKQDQEEKQFEENRKKTEQNAFNLLRDFTTQMAQKLNSGGYSSTEYCTNPCYFSKTGQFWKSFGEIEGYHQFMQTPSGSPQYAPPKIIKNNACINKNALAGYNDFKKECESNCLAILGREFNCKTIDDCIKKVDFYSKRFYVQIEKNASEWIVEHHHGILLTLSLVSALIPVAGPFLSLTFDLADAFAYYKQGENYSAGLSLIFAVIPAGILIADGVKLTSNLAKSIEFAAALSKEGKLTEEAVGKLFTKEDLKTLQELNSPVYLRTVVQESINTMVTNMFKQHSVEKILKHLRNFESWRESTKFFGTGCMFAGMWYTWHKLAKKFNISDKSEQEKIQKEVEQKLINNMTTYIVEEKNLEEKKKALEMLTKFTESLEKDKIESKKEIIRKDDDGKDIDVNKIPW